MVAVSAQSLQVVTVGQQASVAYYHTGGMGVVLIVLIRYIYMYVLVKFISQLFALWSKF